MKRNRIIPLILAAILAVVTACTPSGTNTGGTTTGSTTPAPATDSNAADTGTTPAVDNASIEETGTETGLEPYSYNLYFNYDWWSIKPWAADETSQFLKEKFNVDVEFTKPDADPEARLNIMISSGDLPDAIMMDRDQSLLQLARNGLLQSLDPLRANNSDYDDNVLKATSDMLRIDGELYTIPQWARKAPTGGNLSWMYNKKMYEQAGSPDMSTFEGLYAYAKAVKDTIPQTEDGLSVIPFATATSKDGAEIMHGFYRSFGGPPPNDWYVPVNQELKVVFRDPIYRDAIMEANKWFREGLIPETIFSDSGEQGDEKIIAGRTALLYYDFSKDSWNFFRQLLQEADPDNDYVIVTDPIYPPAQGLPADRIYADAQSSAGGSGVHITIKAEQPQRIFDLHSYLMTKEGAITMMYGPKGTLWEETDQNGNPILLKAESEITPAESDRLGLWFWIIPGHADNVDSTKFAINAALPPEKQSWVTTNQANIFTPEMFVTDEFFGLRDVIDAREDLGIQRTLCEDQIKAMVPRIIMADSTERAAALYDELVQFLDANGMPEIERVYNEKYQENCAIQGGSRFNK